MSTRLRRPEPDPRAELVEHRGEFVRIAGEIAGIGYEHGRDVRGRDHMWISIRAGRFGPLRVAINTFSVINFESGFDARISVGIARSTYEALPEAGVFACDGFDYAKLEAGYAVQYELCVQERVETHVADRVRRAIFAEAWGDLYARNHPGVHQVHSRRASCAVPRDIVGRDGALRFYFAEESHCETLLFKFCGQP